MGPTVIGRPQGPQSLWRAVLAAVYALFPELQAHVAAPPSLPPAPSPGRAVRVRRLPVLWPVGMPPSRKQGIGVGGWGVSFLDPQLQTPWDSQGSETHG